MGLRERILAAKGLHTETMEIPEWGETITIRSLTVAQREAIDTLVSEAKKSGQPISVFALIVGFSILDEDGRRVFSNEDIRLFDDHNSGPFERIWDWHAKHSGIGGKALETAVKNSGSGQNGATSSVSPSA